MNRKHNVIPFPAVLSDSQYSPDEYSRLFLTVLLKNISQLYQLDDQLAAEKLMPYLPGLHSLTQTVIQQIRSNPTHARLANEILAESIINSFTAAGLVLN